MCVSLKRVSFPKIQIVQDRFKNQKQFSGNSFRNKFVLE